MKDTHLSRYFMIRIRCCAVKNSVTVMREEDGIERKETGVESRDLQGQAPVPARETMRITTQQFNSIRFLRAVHLVFRSRSANRTNQG